MRKTLVATIVAMLALGACIALANQKEVFKTRAERNAFEYGGPGRYDGGIMSEEIPCLKREAFCCNDRLVVFVHEGFRYSLYYDNGTVPSDQKFRYFIRPNGSKSDADLILVGDVNGDERVDYGMLGAGSKKLSEECANVDFSASGEGCTFNIEGAPSNSRPFIESCSWENVEPKNWASNQRRVSCKVLAGSEEDRVYYQKEFDKAMSATKTYFKIP